jgi:TolB-like protein
MALIAELKRRNVFRVGVAYAIVSWLLIEVASVLLPTFDAPDWVMKAFSSLVILGFPLALIFAWAFELTPEGIKRDADVDRTEPVTRKARSKLDFAIVGLLAIAVVYFAVDKFVLQDERIPATGSTGQVKTIAVLPFANMSGDPEQEFFSDGISEELLNVLAKVKGLQVTSRTSAFAFKGTNTSVPEIAEKLGVEHVLEGSVRMAGDRVRITAQLIEVETDSHLWSESYDRVLSDIFAVQDEIAKEVGEALKVALLGADSRPIRPSRETSIEVYSDYLLARQKLANPTVGATDEAERLLKSVIERDPKYAPAYAALAGTYQARARWGWLSLSNALARMRPLVEHALSLDRDLAEAWQRLAYVDQASGDLESARTARERALELGPQDPFVLFSQIVYWLFSHEPERGLVFADEWLRVDPMSPKALSWVSYLYERLERHDDANQILERIRLIDSQNIYYWWNRAFYSSNRGDLVTAIRSMEENAAIDPSEGMGPATIALWYFDLGDVAAAEFWKEASLQRDPESPRGRLAAAILHLYHNEQTAALAVSREIVQRDARNKQEFASALRIIAASDLAAGNYQDIIDRYVSYFPVLADGKLPGHHLALEGVFIPDAFRVALDLAAAYLRAGEKAKADSLLSLIESELSHWPKRIDPGFGFADVGLHALRGDKDRALAALREHVVMGTRFWWRWELLYNPNLKSIRDTPEFATIVAEIEADMATQLARVREMERNGELEPIPEVSATAH